jgi:N-acetylmuramoyl-L-alanine amidase
MTYAQFITALTLWREASGCSHDARVGIFQVIRNRVARGGWWGTDLVSVCLKPFQFSSMSAPGDANLRRWPAGTETVWLDCLCIAASDPGADVTSGATYYWTGPLTKAPTEWGSVTETVAIDGVHFCKGN